jgi:hypothetical protein
VFSGLIHRCEFAQAMYPTLVMVLVHNHQSFDQVYFMDPSLPPISVTSGGGNNRNLTGPIAFAVPTSMSPSSTGMLPEQAEGKGDSHHAPTNWELEMGEGRGNMAGHS